MTDTIPFPGGPPATTPTPDDLNVPSISISPSLIINALKCIDAAASRGAYQGGELSAVGGIRDNLYGLIKPIAERLKKEQDEAAAKAEANVAANPENVIPLDPSVQ